MSRIKLLTEAEGDALTQEIFDEIKERVDRVPAAIVALDLQPEE